VRRRVTTRRTGPGSETGPAPARDRLWAPWRARWIRAAHKPEGCLFCRVATRHADRADLVLARRPHAFLMLNRYPYNPAHLMVAIARHVGSVARLSGAERADWLELVALAEKALATAYRPHGLNYGANSGRVAGAGFPDHLHLHLVPRWNGDTNFMPVVGGTRVLPESLTETWTRLRRAIGALERGRERGRGR
jgi:ATP adenylyltransferase